MRSLFFLVFLSLLSWTYHLKTMDSDISPLVETGGLSSCNKDEFNQPDDYGYTPLYHAVFAKNGQLVAQLLAQGASNIVNKQSEGGHTIFWLAVFMGNQKIIDLMLESHRARANNDTQSQGNHQFDVMVKNSRGETPLFWAAKTGNLALIKTLLSMGCEREHTDNEGHTALYWAARYEKNEIVAFLQTKSSFFSQAHHGQVDLKNYQAACQQLINDRITCQEELKKAKERREEEMQNRKEAPWVTPGRFCCLWLALCGGCYLAAKFYGYQIL